MSIKFGSFSDDNITATDGNDLIISFKGDDIIFAGDGNDLVIAGSGDDTVYGGGGNDTILGGSGDDTLFGEDGDDSLFGGSGNDNLDGGEGDDLIYGGSGFDQANFAGSVFDYDIASGRHVTRITETATGAQDYLVSIEAIHFAAEDYTLYTDGRDNAVLFTGEASGAVTEDAGTPATGTLIATDFDGTDGIVAASGDATYGSFAIGTDGVWTYTLDDGNATVDALNTGDTLTDSFDVLAEDGTVQTVSITINGADDAPTDTPASLPFTEGADSFILYGGSISSLPTVQIDGETWYQANMGGGTDQFWLGVAGGKRFIVSGGADADTFIFGSAGFQIAQEGTMVITDFDTAEDSLELAWLGVGLTWSDASGDLVGSNNFGSTVTLEGLDMLDLPDINLLVTPYYGFEE